MNKQGVQGFAKGGPVGFASGGGVQKFAMGGGVQGMGAIMALSAVLPAVQAGLEGVAGKSQEVEEGFNAIKTGLNVGMATFAIMFAALTFIKKNFDNLRKSTGGADKELKSLKESGGGASKSLQAIAEAVVETPDKMNAESLSISSDNVTFDTATINIASAQVTMAEGGKEVSQDEAKVVQSKELTQEEKSVSQKKTQLEEEKAVAQDNVKKDVETQRGLQEERAGLQGRVADRNVQKDELKAKRAEKSKLFGEDLEDTATPQTTMGGDPTGPVAERQANRRGKMARLDKEIAQGEKSLADTDSGIADDQKELAQRIRESNESYKENKKVLEDANEGLKNLEPEEAEAKKTGDAERVMSEARAQDSPDSPSGGGLSSKMDKKTRARTMPFIAERDVLAAGQGDLKDAADKKHRQLTSLDKGVGKVGAKRAGLEQKLKSTPKGDLPERKRLEQEIKKLTAGEKKLNKRKKQILKEHSKLYKGYQKNAKQINKLDKVIAKGASRTNLALKRLSSGIKKGVSSVSGGLKKVGRKLAEAGKKFLGKGATAGGIAKNIGGMLPGLGGAAVGMLAAANDYQSQQFDKAVSSGDPADLITARGMVEGNVDMEMAQGRLTDTLAGAAAGAAAGSFFGPIGMAIGGALGGAGGFFKDEIFSALGIGPSREEKREQKVNAMNTRIAETNLDKNILPALKKSMESFVSSGSDTDFGNSIKGFETAREEIKTIAKSDKGRADEREKQLETQAKLLAGSVGSSAGSQAELNKRILELSKKFPELSEELGNTAKSAFILAEANRAQVKMQADILKVSSAFRAASLGVNNFLDSMQTGANSWNQTVNTIKEAQSNIALGKDSGAAVQEARKRVQQQFKNAGAGGSEAAAAADRQFDLLEQASSFSSSLPTVLANTTFDRGGTDEAIKSDITESLLGAAGVSADSQLGKVIAGRAESLTPEQLAALRNGTLDLSNVFSDLQGQVSKLGSGALAAAEAMQAHENTIIKLTAARIKAEQGLIATQKKAVDLQLEAAQIASKFGGAAVTAEQRRNAAIEKFNLTAGRVGAGALSSGTGADIRNASGNLAGQFASLEMRANRPGGFGGAAGLDADKRNEIARAQSELVGVTKALIEADKQELDIIKKKNALEKESLDKLIGGDTAGFIQGMAANAATSLIASGDASGLSGDTLAQALESIKKQRAAGVTDIDGIDIRTVEQRAAQAALAARGVTDPRAAAMVAGQTREEEEVEARIRERAGALGAIGENMVDMAQMQVQTAEMTITQANVKFQQGLAQASSNIEGAAGLARGGMVYASRGMFVPRGTDTVPAMLTPGEFVVNRSSVNRGNNLQILRAINNGSQAAAPAAGSAATMNQGGQVGYYNNGGSVAGGMDASIIEGLNAFNTAFAQNISNLQNTRFQIKLDTTTVNVNLNGGSFLNSMKEEVKSELLS
jgi:hypothetical protein